jgi:hypothetical protein
MLSFVVSTTFTMLSPLVPACADPKNTASIREQLPEKARPKTYRDSL